MRSKFAMEQSGICSASRFVLGMRLFLRRHQGTALRLILEFFVGETIGRPPFVHKNLFVFWTVEDAGPYKIYVFPCRDRRPRRSFFRFYEHKKTSRIAARFFFIGYNINLF